MNSSCTSASDFIFTDAIGKNYAVKDVSTAGDCALLSLMGNPNFQASLSTANELRRAVVTFARGVKQQDCITVYSLVGDRSNMNFEVYLENVMQAGFWVGTIFFIWISMAFGVTICSHFFNEFREPKCESTAELLSKYFSKKFSNDLDQQPVVDVFFHQYRCMTRYKPSMYNILQL
jgi:hypothetical protein